MATLPDLSSSDFGNDFNFWRLCDELSIFQAAALVIGKDPVSEDIAAVENWDVTQRPQHYEAARTAISNALRSNSLNGSLAYQIKSDLNGRTFEDPRTIDVHRSIVEVSSLKAWLAKRGFKSGFFFPRQPDAPSYLDKDHPRYAPKLAAALQAWMALEGVDPAGTSPKKMILKWLREHAAEFDLADEEGRPNEQGIEETAKVANWQPLGGAPKTPGQAG